MEKSPSALYVFCFARSDLVHEVEGSGVDGQHPLSIFRRFPNLCAVLSEVAVEDFCGPAAERQMQQLAWVGPRGLRHEAVVEQVMRHSPVLPTRFGTLFSSEGRLAEFLEVHRDTILRFLARVADQDEWSIKGLLDRKQAGEALISAHLAAQQVELATLPPGTRYLVEQRVRSAAQQELSRWLNETCWKLADDLQKLASDFRSCPLPPGQPPENGTEVVLHWALLLPKGATVPFRSHIDQVNAMHATRGLVLELSGPWPPYRFVPALSMGPVA